MLITDRACIELQRLLRENLARPRQAVRLHSDEAGSLAMTIDVPHPGDSVFRRDNAVLLILDGRLSSPLAQRILDFPTPSDRSSRGGFTLHRRGWAPPAPTSMASL